MEIHIARDGRQLGPFPLQEVQRMLHAAELRTSDLAWTDGLSEWVPLNTIQGVVSPTPPPTRSGAPGAAAPPLYRPQSPAAVSARALPTMLPPTSSLAIASLVLGIVSIGMLPLISSIPAVVCGHMARGEIKRAEGRLTGDGLAVAGLITGYFSIALSVLMIGLIIAMMIFGLAFGTRLMDMVPKALEEGELDHGRQIAMACRAYAADHQGNFPEELDKLVPKYLKDRSVLVVHLGGPIHHAGFVYFGGRDTDPGDKVLCYSKDADRNDRRMVVRVDGSVKLEPIPLQLEAPSPR